MFAGISTNQVYKGPWHSATGRNCHLTPRTTLPTAVGSFPHLPDLLSIQPVDVVINHHKAPQASSHLGLRAQGAGEGAWGHATQQGLQGGGGREGVSGGNDSSRDRGCAGRVGRGQAAACMALAAGADVWTGWCLSGTEQVSCTHFEQHCESAARAIVHRDVMVVMPCCNEQDRQVRCCPLLLPGLSASYVPHLVV